MRVDVTDNDAPTIDSTAPTSGTEGLLYQYDLSCSDPAGASVSLRVGSHEVGLYEGKSLASIDGDLRLLSAPVRHENGRWLVPVDGVPRLLGPLIEQPVEWRAAQRVLVVGRVSIPQVDVTAFASADLVRVVFDASESVPFKVEQGGDRVVVSVARDLMK